MSDNDKKYKLGSTVWPAIRDFLNIPDTVNPQGEVTIRLRPFQPHPVKVDLGEIVIRKEPPHDVPDFDDLVERARTEGKPGARNPQTGNTMSETVRKVQEAEAEVLAERQHLSADKLRAMTREARIEAIKNILDGFGYRESDVAKIVDKFYEWERPDLFPHAEAASRLECELSETRKQLKVAQTQLADAQRAAEQQRKIAAANYETYSALERRHSELARRCETQERQLNTLTGELTDARLELQDATSKLKASATISQIRADGLDRMEAAALKLQTERDEMQRQLQEARTKINTVQDAAARVQREAEYNGRQAMQYMQAVEALQAELATARSESSSLNRAVEELQQANDKTLLYKGVFIPVGEVLSVSSEEIKDDDGDVIAIEYKVEVRPPDDGDESTPETDAPAPPGANATAEEVT